MICSVVVSFKNLYSNTNDLCPLFSQLFAYLLSDLPILDHSSAYCSPIFYLIFSLLCFALIPVSLIIFYHGICLLSALSILILALSKSNCLLSPYPLSLPLSVLCQFNHLCPLILLPVPSTLLLTIPSIFQSLFTFHRSPITFACPISISHISCYHTTFIVITICLALFPLLAALSFHHHPLLLFLSCHHIKCSIHLSHPSKSCFIPSSPLHHSHH